MSYTEHTWVDGETITAAKMNNIEEGIAEAAQSGGGGNIASVVVEGNGSFGTMIAAIVIYRDKEGSLDKSIESAKTEDYLGYYMDISGYNKKIAVALPLDLPDGLHIGVAVTEYIALNYDITTTGQIAQEPVSGSYRYGATAWESTFYSIYEVTGNGTFTVAPK